MIKNKFKEIFMKNFKKICNVIVLIVVILSALSCNNCDDDPINTNKINSVNTIIINVNKGSWRISYYWNANQNKTSNFDGYSFKFMAYNVLNTNNSINTFNGNWAVIDSNVNSDSLSDIIFKISFNDPSSFKDLTNDWIFIEKTTTLLKLKKLGINNEITDYLTLTRN